MSSPLAQTHPPPRSSAPSTFALVSSSAVQVFSIIWTSTDFFSTLSNSWHALFRKPFTSVGYEPTSAFVGRFAGKRAGRAAGALVVFALSGWMHAQGEYCLWLREPQLTSLPTTSPLLRTLRR